MNKQAANPFMGHLSNAVAGAAGTAMAAGAVGLAGMAANKIYDAATKARDFRGMMGSSFNQDLHDHYRERPQQFLEAYNTLRNTNADFSKDPMIAGTYMRRVMTDMPERAGGYLMEALQHKDKYPTPMRDIFMRGAGEGAIKGYESSVKQHGADIEHGRRMLSDALSSMRQQQNAVELEGVRNQYATQRAQAEHAARDASEATKLRGELDTMRTMLQDIRKQRGAGRPLAMFKVSLYRGVVDGCPSVIPIHSAEEVFHKVASPRLLPDVARYIERLRPTAKSQYVLVNAMGAGEYWGSNSNGDHFPEAALIHAPSEWTGNPIVDRVRAKDWPYGYPTFYKAHPYAHHRNKDATRAFGEVELAVWNDRMKRVELVVRVDEDKCQRFGGAHIWDRLSMGQFVDVSMGCRVPWDRCSICTDMRAYHDALSTFDPKKHKHPGEAVLAVHKAKKLRGIAVTRAEYCDHARNNMNKILADGRKIFVYNDFPSFFDISFVFIGADKTAKTMLKIASSTAFWDVGLSVDIAASLGYVEDDEKTAGDTVHRKTEFQGIPVHIDRPKGFKQHFGEKQGLPTWTRTYKTDYGFIPGTKDKDGEETDVYLGKHPDASHAFVIKQMINGKHDENKIMLGFKTEEQAKRMFLAHSSPEYKKTIIGGITSVPMEEIKERFKTAEEKAADEFKEALLGKGAKIKRGEIKKEIVPSQFAGKAVPMITPKEDDLPSPILKALGGLSLPDLLNTTSSAGIVLRPREFQRVILIRSGGESLADDLDSKNVIFPRVKDEDASIFSGEGGVEKTLLRLLAPLLEGRSCFGPMIERRTLVLMHRPSNKEAAKKATSLNDELLHKIGATYNGYRKMLLDKVAEAQTQLADAGVSDPQLSRLAQLPQDELFTPMSAAYLKNAFWDEAGSATVEKSASSSKNMGRATS